MGPLPPAEGGSGGELPVVDFAGMWQTLKRWWWLPLLTGLIVTGGVGAYLWKAPRFYTATAELAVDQEKSSVLPGNVLKPEDLRSLEILSASCAKGSALSVCFLPASAVALNSRHSKS